MNINELYLKTAFCCMACDGDIANEEVQLIKDYTKKSDLFVNLDVEKLTVKSPEFIHMEMENREYKSKL